MLKSLVLSEIFIIAKTKECGFERDGIGGVYCGYTEIIAQDIFSTSGGNIVAKKGARIVERTVTEIEIGE